MSNLFKACMAQLECKYRLERAKIAPGRLPPPNFNKHDEHYTFGRMEAFLEILAILQSVERADNLLNRC